MSHWLTPQQLRQLRRGYQKGVETPIPTQVVSSGECYPPRQSRQQAQVESLIHQQAQPQARRLGLPVHEFLRSRSGMASAFMAMNTVHGDLFDVTHAETEDLAAAEEQHARTQEQFIFDVHTHHVHEDYTWEGQLWLRDAARGNNQAGIPFNPELVEQQLDLKYYKFDYYLKDMFFDSDTTLALLSTSPSVDPQKTLLDDRQITATRDRVNQLAGTRRMFAHGVIWPSVPGYLEAMVPAAEELKVDAWKGYTIGDVLGETPSFEAPWRLDDPEVTWPTLQRALDLGIPNICIHKGVLPMDYQQIPNWQYACVDDVGGAAQAWPGLNFHIYHAGLKMWTDADAINNEFEQTGRVPWIDDLAEIPARYGVTNVYADIGLSFGALAITHPRLAAVMVARLVAGMGSDHVLWGTDSIWFGSPQWQIEAFRRIELPTDLQDRLQLDPLGPADGAVKNAIFGINAAGQYGIELDADGRPLADYAGDRLARLKKDYQASGEERDNLVWGWIQNT